MTSLPPVHLLTTSAEVLQLVEHLRHEPQLAMDTESNNMFAYREQVCLIQISTRHADFLLDPLAIDDLHPLQELTAAPHIEKVFHAADHDIFLLQRDCGLEFKNIFDTMHAARILGIEKAGLSNLVKKFFDIKLDKSLQRADWGKRPLSPDHIEYARLDTRYLLDLRDCLYAQLVEQDALTEALEIFEDVLSSQPAFLPQENTPWYVHGAHLLKPNQVKRLHGLYLWREAAAQQADLPTFKVLTDETLVLIAQANPASLKKLAKIEGMTGRNVRLYGKDILKSLDTSKKGKPERLPHRRPADAAAHDRHERLKEWRKQRAATRGVASDIILSRDKLWQIAKAKPQTLEELKQVAQLGPWRLAQYGEDILRLLVES